MRFDKSYWDENYETPDEMDCIGNVHDHVRYLKSILSLQGVDVATLIDYGFGKGVLFREMIKGFGVSSAVGIEPSATVFNEQKESKKIKLYNQTLGEWFSRIDSTLFDLGICTSVFQYLNEDEIGPYFKAMGNQVRYLYFTVPTDLELARQKRDFNFCDRHAHGRTQEFYLNALRPYFTIVGSRLLESRIHFSDQSTLFSEMLFRL